MIALSLSLFLLFAAYPFTNSVAAIWLLVGSQLVLLLGVIWQRQVTGAGGFIFMSFLFFGVRALFMVFERDNMLFTNVFLIRPSLEDITMSVWWASCALCAFALGVQICGRANTLFFRRRLRVSGIICKTSTSVSNKMAWFLISLQVATLPVMVVLASFGTSLYGSAFGAYAYDLPVPLQSIHVFTLLVLVEKMVNRRQSGMLLAVCLSGLLFLVFTYLMRDVSAFRSFYLSGVIIVCVAILQQVRGRATYVWLIVPIMVLQPVFQYLGQQRNVDTEVLLERDMMSEIVGNQTLGQTYWNFYRSNGDMNILDTFVAASKTEPSFRPYLWSWLYVPLHLVPRKLWAGKPEAGITQDMRFTRGAPLSPGIAGFFMRDGGHIWMLLCMAVLGYGVSFLDRLVLTMPRGYLQSCLIGIVVVNGMYLSRFFLWQYFYQLMYAAVPCILLAWYVGWWRSQGRLQRMTNSATGHYGRHHAQRTLSA